MEKEYFACRDSKIFLLHSSNSLLNHKTVLHLSDPVKCQNIEKKFKYINKPTQIE